MFQAIYFTFFPTLYLQDKSATTSHTFLPSLFHLKCPSFSALPDGITSHFKVYLKWSVFHEASLDLTAFELSVVMHLVPSSATGGCLIQCPLVPCQIALAKQELYQVLFTPRQGLCHGSSLLAFAEFKQDNGCFKSRWNHAKGESNQVNTVMWSVTNTCLSVHWLYFLFLSLCSWYLLF